MGTVTDAEDTCYELKASTIKEDVNLARATRFPGDVFWRLSKYLSGSGKLPEDDPLKKKSKRWPIILIGILVVLGISAVVVLSLGAPYMKKTFMQRVLIEEQEHVFVNISDPSIQAYILNLPQRDKDLDQDVVPTIGNPFAEKTDNSLFAVAAAVTSPTLAPMFSIGDISNKHKELRKSRFSSAVEFELSNGNKYFLCLDEVPKSSYVHLAQHLCGGTQAGTIHTVYGTNSSLVTSASKQAAQGIYECTSSSSCIIKACSTCTCREVISATCVLNSVPVARAIRGRYSEEGFLQLFVEQQWGYVCVSDYRLGANLVCETLSSRMKPRFARFTEVKEQTCNTAPRTMGHLDIHINCPSTATSISDCTFENKPCSGKYVWIQCEPFINNITQLPASLSYTPNSAYIYPSKSAIASPGCDFENGICGWTQTTTDDADWIRQQGTNTSAWTGPNCTDYTTDVNRYFLLFDASSPRRPTQKAEILTPLFNSNGACLRYKYNANGDAAGLLTVHLRENSSGNDTAVSSINSSPEEKSFWKSVKVTLPDLGMAQLVFTAVRGLGVRSDFGIDDVEIGPCSGSLYFFSSSCNHNELYCSSSQTCLPLGTVCDNEMSCSSSEESGGTCSTTHATVHVCPDGTRIPLAYKCDGQKSCNQVTSAIQDETGCSGCQSYETACGNGLCFQSTHRCNGVNECGNWFDERGCSVCGFQCADTGCLPDPLMQCDGVPQCADATDEAGCSTNNQDFSSATPAGAVVSDMESDPTGGFKPLMEDSSTYANRAFKTSVVDRWGYITMPAASGPTVRCISFRLAGMKNLTSAAVVQITTIGSVVVETIAPLVVNPPPQDGVYRLTRLEVKIPYTTARVRIGFALQNAFLDDITLASSACPSTYGVRAITPQGFQLPVTTSTSTGSTCEFSTDFCNMDQTAFVQFGTQPYFERIILTNTRASGRLEFYFDNKAIMATVLSTNFTQEMVNAVCYLRGYSTGRAVDSGVFGAGAGSCIKQLFCPSPLKNIFDCFQEGVVPAAQCDHRKDVGIICSGEIVADADLQHMQGTSFISTNGVRSTSVLRATVSTAIQCVEFSYKMSSAGWIYAGGAASSAFKPLVTAPFQTWGAVFTNISEIGRWHTVQAPLSGMEEAYLIAQPVSGQSIHLTNVTFMTTACTMSHPYNDKTEVLCANQRQSYPLQRRCDGFVDCADGSDEAHSLCDKATFCQSSVPAGLPECRNWTISGPDSHKPCTSPCSSVDATAPDGTTGHPFCTTANGWGRCNTQEMAIDGNAPDGSQCAAFFYYKNVRYIGCTTVDNPKPWCALTVAYNGMWGVCGGCPMIQRERGTKTGGTCVFPFIFNGLTFLTCTNYGWIEPWCATTDSYDRDRQWGPCGEVKHQANETQCRERTYGGTSDGTRCVFPFNYNGQDYNECLPDPNNNNYRWCSITRVYQGAWGYCGGCPDPDPFSVQTIAGYGNTGGQLCAFPFLYKDRWYHDCTVVEFRVPWCSTTHIYDLAGGWAACGSFSATHYSRHPVCMDTAFTFEDGTLMGGVQSAAETVRWRHTFNVTKTQRTSPRGGAGKRTMQSLYYADLPEVFGKPVDFSTSQSPGGYIYADMSNAASVPGSRGSIRFVSPIHATCIQACVHMVGKHVGTLQIWINDVYRGRELNGEQIDPLSETSLFYQPSNNWKCFRYEPGGHVYVVTFIAIKGKGAEGDIAIDEVHFLESCHLKTIVCPKGYFSCGDGICIRNSQVCDCQRQCWNNADEASCQSRPACGSHQFSCGGGCCVDMVDKCDGFGDCPLSFDEAASVCNGNITPPSATGMGAVTVTSTGEYYTSDERCNGRLDTLSAEDEVNCTCSATEFGCGGWCIPFNKTCDKNKDCPGGEDEAPTCQACPLDQFTCDDQSCVPGSSLCNGTYECSDKSDEPAHQCPKACPFSMANLPSKYASLVVGTTPANVSYGGTYQLQLTCNGTWWSKATSYNMQRWLTFWCIDSGESLGPSASMDIECIPPFAGGLLPAGPVHFTDPVDFHGKDYINLAFGFSPFGSAGSQYVKIKGKEVTSLNLWKSGLISQVVPSGVTTAPSNYTFLKTENLRFRDVFSVLSVEVDMADPGYIFFDQFNKPKFNDVYLAHYANATCAVLPGGCAGAMFDPTYAAVFTFHRVKDKQGNLHDAQLALVTDNNVTVALLRYVTHPAVSSSNELGMLLMTTDFLRPDKLATSGYLTNHGTHGTNGDYLEEIAAFTTKSKPATILDFGSSAGDTTIELKSFSGTTSTMAAPSGGLNVFDYMMNETALIPAGGRVAFGMAGSTTYETGGSIASTLATEQATFTAVNTAFSPSSSSGFVHQRFTTDSAELAKSKTEVCAAQTLIDCASWNPTLAYVATYQGIMIDDGNVDFEGFGNTYQMIIATNGSTSFGIVHYAMMLEYWDYTGNIEYKGARLKNGFMRELIPGQANNKDTLFNAQFSKNASTDGAYVVLFDGFPCPLGTPANFTLESGYPDPLLTTHSYPFKFLCNGGRGSPFDWKTGIPGPGRVLNPWTIQCDVQAQGLPIDFNTALDGFECRKHLYFFGSELGTGVQSVTSNYYSKSFSNSVRLKGNSRSTWSIGKTGSMTEQGTNAPLAQCQAIRGTNIQFAYGLFVLFGVPFSTRNIFLDSFSTSGSNSVQLEQLARAKKEVCMHKNQPVASCTFNPTYGIVMTHLDSVTEAPAVPNVKLTGQIMMVRDTSKSETYTFFIYENYINVTTTSCPAEMGMLTRTADLFLIPENPHQTSNIGLAGEHIVETGNRSTHYIPTNFYTPLPNNILDNQYSTGYGTHTLPLGSINVFDYTFSSVYVNVNQGSLLFGGTDPGTECHNLPITAGDADVYIIMVNWDVDFQSSNRMYIGDTNDTTAVSHFRTLACNAHAGLCPDWQPNRILTVTILGVDTDDGGALSGSYQQTIVTNGTTSYFVGSYGIETSYNRQYGCGYRYRGAVANRDKVRYLDTDPRVTTITSLNIWTTQFRNNTGTIGTWSISVDGFPCNVSTWVPTGFTGVFTFPSTIDTTESFMQTFTCTGGFGVPFDKIMGLATAGGTKMNNQTLTCTPAVQGNTIGFNTMQGYTTDLTRFTCLPFYHCCSEAGTARLPTTELSSNNGYVDRTLSTSLMIKGENFASVRIYDNGVVSFRQISAYSVASCFAFFEHQPQIADMAPFFSVISGGYESGSGGVFMDQYSSNSMDIFATKSLASMSGLVNQYITGVSMFSASYALVVSYLDYIPSSAPVSNNSAQLTIVTDGSDTFAILKYLNLTTGKGNTSCPQQLGMVAQSGDFFDIWSMVTTGNGPQDHGNAGTGTYVVQIGKRVANIPPPYFHPFGTAVGDTEIDIASMANASGAEIDRVQKNMTATFRVHAYNYDSVHFFTDGMIAFAFKNTSVPGISACTSYAAGVANTFPKQTTYIKMFPTDLTAVDTYGAIYYRNIPVNTGDPLHAPLLAKFTAENVPITNPTRMMVITYHGIRITNKQSSVSVQLVLLTDGDITQGLYILGPVTEYDHHNCLSSVRSIVNRNQIRTITSLSNGQINSWQSTDRFHGFTFTGHPCPLNSDISHLSPFNISRMLPATIPADKNEMYNVTCENGFVFDYATGYNTVGQHPGLQTVQCPPYVQGETRTLPAIIDAVCLDTLYTCCSGMSLPMSGFTNNFQRMQITQSNGFFFDGTKEDYIIIGKTGFLSVETTVLTKNLESPKCVNTTAHTMTQFLNYISLLGQDFNYTDTGGIFFEEFSSSATALYSKVSSDVAAFKGSSFTPDHVILISYIGVKDPVNGQRQNAQLAIAYDSTETYIIMLYDDYSITSTSNCSHHIGIRTKSANAMDINRSTVLTNTNHNGRRGVYIWENRKYLTKSKDVGYNLFNFSTTDDIYTIYKMNNPSSPLMDDTVNKYSISTLFSGSKTTFNTFDHTYTHIGVGQGMIYFGDAPMATQTFPENYCVKRDTGLLNMTYVMLMGHDQNPEISPGALHIEVLTSGSLLTLFDRYVCPHAGSEYCDSPAFTANQLIIITYHGLTGIDGEKYANTYQAVFGSNGTASFVVFIYSIVTDYAAPDCFEYIGVRPPKHLYRTTVDHITNGIFDRQGYFDHQYFTNCQTCPNNTGVYVLSLDGFPCTWDTVMLGNFRPQTGCCGTRVRTTESITIVHSCTVTGGYGYIHKYSGTDQTPGSDTLTCTPTVQGEIISLKNVSGYVPLFPYYCLSNYFTSCCHTTSATNQGTSSFTNGWLSISLTTNLLIKGTNYNNAMLSNTGFLFFNATATISPPTCYNFTLLDNRVLIPAFSLFSETLIVSDGETNSATGRIYVEQFTSVPTGLSNTASGISNPTYALLISVVEAPLGNSNGPRQSGQLAFVTNGTATDAIFKYEKYNGSSDSCKIGAILRTADILDIRGKQAKANAAVAGSTHVMSIGPKITNTEPLNMIPFLSHNRIPYFMTNTQTKVLNDDKDIQISIGTTFKVFDQSMTVVSMTDNGYITLGTSTTPFPDQYCITKTGGYQNVVFLMALNYDLKPEHSTGALYYTVTTSSSTLAEIVKEVCASNGIIDNCENAFQPRRAVIVTVSGINAFDQITYGNTFQLIVASDGEITFGIIIYGVILGYQGDSDCQQWRGAKFTNSSFNVIKEIGTSPNSHDEIYAAQHNTNAMTTGRYVIAMYNTPPIVSSNCTFEGPTFCGWLQDTNDYQNYDWILKSGPTSSSNTGPPSAYAGSYYIYIETSCCPFLGRYAKITLPSVSYTGSVCLVMQTHMYGSSINKLEIFTRSGSTDTVRHSVSGNQGNQWIRRNFTITNYNPSLLIGLNGIAGNDFTGDISIDEVYVSQGAC